MAYIAFPHPLTYNGSRLENPLVKDEKELKDVEYDDRTWGYFNYLQQRLRKAQEARDVVHPEFAGLTYLKYYENNEKIANTYLDATKNKNEKPLATGTIESKLNTLCSHLNNLNLVPKVYAFDKNNIEVSELGTSFTDIMVVTAEHDGMDDGGDKEKRLLRQRELLKQGTVFVQENYLTKYQVRKKLKDLYRGEFNNFAGYEEKLVKVFEGCSREVLYGPNVYLGDITQFSMADQPYIFTVETMSYDVAKTIFSQFENFKFVRPGRPQPMGTETTQQVGGRTIYDAKFRISAIADNMVEVIKYQDPHSDEWALIVNGVLLTPAGFPLSAVTPNGGYNVAKQVLFIINGQFAYGKSFVSSGAVYEVSRALDQMLRSFDLKTRKSIHTPYVNITNRVIPARVLDPGNITMGIPPNALQPIGNEGQGVTSSEYNVYKELQNTIEQSTISSIFQGQQAKSGATATEIMEVQRQAKLNLGLIIAAATMLEMKIAYLRLYNIIGKWLEPIGAGADGKLAYRNASRKTSIDGFGMGERRIIPIDGELPPPEVIRLLSLEDEQRLDMPVRRYYLSPKALREAEILWRIIVEAQEEETSAYETIRFREKVTDAMTLAQIGAKPNVEGITDEYARVYQVDKGKFFTKEVAPMTPPAEETGTPSAPNGVPQSAPVAEPMAGRPGGTLM